MSEEPTLEQRHRKIGPSQKRRRRAVEAMRDYIQQWAEVKVKQMKRRRKPHELPADEQYRLDEHTAYLIREACKAHDVDPATFYDRWRPMPKVRARDWVIWHLRLVMQNSPVNPNSLVIPGDGRFFPGDWRGWCELSYPRIGRLLHMDHTGVLYAYRRECKRRTETANA